MSPKSFHKRRRKNSNRDQVSSSHREKGEGDSYKESIVALLGFSMTAYISMFRIMLDNHVYSGQ